MTHRVLLYENIFCPYGKCEEEACFITTVYATIINTHSNHYLVKWEVSMVRLVKGENDLATVNPVLAKEWHPTKNGNLNPEDITSGSSKEVWWLCPKGHSYSMVVNQRTKRGYDCPYCSGHRVLKGINDLATTNPDLAKEWNYDKNIDLTPYDVTAGSRKKYGGGVKKDMPMSSSLSNEPTEDTLARTVPDIKHLEDSMILQL